MTDYTPENRIQEQVDRLHDRSTAAEESLKFTDRKFAKLVREATRLKQERDDLLSELRSLWSTCAEQIRRFDRMGKSHSELSGALDDAGEVIRRIDRE